jgi:hypothetical protein
MAVTRAGNVVFGGQGGDASLAGGRLARNQLVVGFEARSPGELAELVSEWLRESGEKVILQRDFLVSYDEGWGAEYEYEGDPGLVYSAFIVYTE